jgi:polyisoprenoid-binding protein YceI
VRRILGKRGVVRVVLCAAGVGTLPALAAAQPREFRIDADHSTVGFTVSVIGGLSEVRGEFAAVDGLVRYDPNAPERSSVRVTIDAASVDTGNDGRDDHLRSPDFFDVQRFPTITFHSERITRDGEGFRVRGPLTIRDVTRTVEFRLLRRHAEPVVEAFGLPSIAFEGALEVDRKEFGVAGNARWNSPIAATGELAMSDTVGIQLRILAQEGAEGR